MASYAVTGGRWTLDVDQQWVDVTSESPTPNERWRFTDSQGHEHHYDHGYPTLDYVIDERHWCDGTEGIYNHDPHWAVDEGHWECRDCREVIEPALNPPYTPMSIPGMRSATLKGRRSDGADVTLMLTGDEYDELEGHIRGGTVTDDMVVELLDNAPNDRLIRVEVASR